MPHGENKHNQSEWQTDPEAPAHFDELQVWTGVGRGHRGLKRHAAYRAGARANLSHLGVHRTGVDDIGQLRNALKLTETM